MIHKCNSGIDLITENLGKLYSNRTYLFYGQQKTGKTSFALQFLSEGAKNGQCCLLVTSHSPQDVVIFAESMGIDITSYLSEGLLLISEYVENKQFFLGQLCQEIKEIVVKNGISRLAIDTFSIPSKGAKNSAKQIPAFLRDIEQLGVTSFVMMGLPFTSEILKIKKDLEDESTGIFFLRSVAENLLCLDMKKLVGFDSSVNREFRFVIRPREGIVEIKKISNLNFPRSYYGPIGKNGFVNGIKSAITGSMFQDKFAKKELGLNTVGNNGRQGVSFSSSTVKIPDKIKKINENLSKGISFSAISEVIQIE